MLSDDPLHPPHSEESDAPKSVPTDQSALVKSPVVLRAQFVEIRQQAQQLFDGGATGIQVGAALSTATDQFLFERMEAAIATLPNDEREFIRRNAAMIAVGGNGRGEMSPYSDVDLLFLYTNSTRDLFSELVSQVVRDCWDANIQLGHAVRSIGDTVALARQDISVATALLQTRLLWGEQTLLAALNQRVAKQVVQRRLRVFTESCIDARAAEREEYGAAATQLEPDVKRSVGGLRDIHLVRWLGFAYYGVSDLTALRMNGAFRKRDARRLLAGQEFLMRLRAEMHFFAGKSQDLLTREEQLRIAKKWGIEPLPGQRSVERFMKTYFQHSTRIAEMTDRFIEVHRFRALAKVHSWAKQVGEFLTTSQVDGFVKLGSNRIDVPRKQRRSTLRTLESFLRLHHLEAMHGSPLAPSLVEFLKIAQKKIDGTVDEASAEWFLKIMRCSGHLGKTLRSMFAIGTLELVIPNMNHARCLLQFNQYHAYTVDEHTFRAIEAVETFGNDEGPLGIAYREIEHKELLHLAILLHDLGKGFEEEHCDVGKTIAATIAVRLFLPEHQRETLMFLVYKHLQMSHLALRRNFADEEVLVEFSKDVGSAEQLRMLYVLTAADLMSVGPKTWTDWKADLLADLYHRTLLILSGKPYREREEQQIAHVKQKVMEQLFLPQPPFASPAELPLLKKELLPEEGDAKSIAAEPSAAEPDHTEKIVEPQFSEEIILQQLAALPSHYLSTTSAVQITADLKHIQQLPPGEMIVTNSFDADTETIEYRVVVDRELSDGCFHKITGALNAKQLEILSAQICTSLNGTVVDSFQVVDHEFHPQTADLRADEVTRAIRKAVYQKTPVKQLFQRYMRFSDGAESEPISKLKTRVVIDNETSKECTVIDIFSYDRRGLLYTVTRAIAKLELSVVLAKVSTHFDQVIDVFYVTDTAGKKIKDSERLRDIRHQLTRVIEKFQQSGHTDYIS